MKIMNIIKIKRGDMSPYSPSWISPCIQATQNKRPILDIYSYSTKNMKGQIYL